MINRRDFLIRVGGVVVAVPAVLQLTACGDDGGGTADATSAAADATSAASFMTSSSMGTHTHTLTVLCADLSSATAVTYTSSTVNAHSHQVTITAAELGMIMSGSSVTINTADGHAHGWTIAKPNGACPS